MTTNQKEDREFYLLEVNGVLEWREMEPAAKAVLFDESACTERRQEAEKYLDLA